MGMERVLFDRDSLGPNIPKRPMMVSRQHRLMLDTIIAERMTGSRQVLVSAYKLSERPGVNIVRTLGFVTYWHFICDQHEIVVADVTPAETLYLGQEARRSMSPDAISEVMALIPSLIDQTAALKLARTVIKGARQNKLVNRLHRNGKSAIAFA